MTAAATAEIRDLLARAIADNRAVRIELTDGTQLGGVPAPARVPRWFTLPEMDTGLPRRFHQSEVRCVYNL